MRWTILLLFVSITISLPIIAMEKKKLPSFLDRHPQLRELDFSDDKYPERLKLASTTTNTSTHNNEQNKIEYTISKLRALKETDLSKKELDNKTISTLTGLSILKKALDDQADQTIYKLERLNIPHLDFSKLNGPSEEILCKLEDSDSSLEGSDESLADSNSSSEDINEHELGRKPTKFTYADFLPKNLLKKPPTED